MGKFKLSTLLTSSRAAIQLSLEGKANLAKPNIARVASLLSGIMNFQAKKPEEEQPTPDAAAFVHLQTLKDANELPEAKFLILNRTGLRAWGDDYETVLAQACQIEVDMDSAETLIVRNDNAGSVYFFGDGYVWLDAGGLGVHLLQKGNN